MSSWVDNTILDARIAVGEAGNITHITGWVVISRDMPCNDWYKKIHHLALYRMQKVYNNDFVVRDNCYVLRTEMMSGPSFITRLTQAMTRWREELESAKNELKALECLGVQFKEVNVSGG